jgi:hypothetical protein
MKAIAIGIYELAAFRKRFWDTKAAHFSGSYVTRPCACAEADEANTDAASDMAAAICANLGFISLSNPSTFEWMANVGQRQPHC